MVRLDQEVIIVTGAGGAIGRAMALALADAGAAVLVNDIDRAAAEATVALITGKSGRAVADPGDITQEAGAQAMAAGCIDAFGTITGLINNAGLLRPAPFLTAEVADLEAMLSVNVVGVFNSARAVIPAMRAKGRGTILNVTSGAQTGQDGLGSYGATKGAVASFTYAWARELQPLGITVNAISPMASGSMTQLMGDYARSQGIAFDPAKFPPPEANTPVAVFLMSEAARSVNGQVIRIVGNKLSIMSHPAIRAPVLQRAAWTAQDVADAFASQLGALQLPTDVATYDIASIS